MLLISMIELEDDRSKIEIIYQEYKNLMLYVANGILEDMNDSEDVVHQSFLKLMKVIHKIDEPKCHKTHALVVTIVERTAIDLYRRRQRDAGNCLDIDVSVIPENGVMSPHLSAQTSPMRIPVYKQRRMPILHGLGLSQRYRLIRDFSVRLNTCMGFFCSLTETSFISATWSPRSLLAYSRMFLRMEITLLTVFGASPVFDVPPSPADLWRTAALHCARYP